MNDNLGPKPVAHTEPPERWPGGADSIADEEKYGAIPDQPTVPNLNPKDNPALENAAPDELSEPEDTGTEATTDGASEPEKEDPA
ncbi:MAG: hypothetical protein ABWX84_07530 [Nocardioides sp.]